MTPVKYFLKDFYWKIFKNEDFGLNIFEKGQILRSFSASTSKLIFFLQKDLMIAYVSIEYSTYQFQKNRRRDGIHPPPRAGLKGLN